MITNVLLIIVYAFLRIISSPLLLLDDVTIASSLLGIMSKINGYFSIGYSLFPNSLTTILTTWGLYISIEIIIFVYKGIRWVYSKIPGVT